MRYHQDGMYEERNESEKEYSGRMELEFDFSAIYKWLKYDGKYENKRKRLLNKEDACGLEIQYRIQEGWFASMTSTS